MKKRNSVNDPLSLAVGFAVVRRDTLNDIGKAYIARGGTE
jgi:hypothetical protein